MENGEWKMENGEWRMDNGKWKMDNGEWTSPRQQVIRQKREEPDNIASGSLSLQIV